MWYDWDEFTPSVALMAFGRCRQLQRCLSAQLTVWLQRCLAAQLTVWLQSGLTGAADYGRLELEPAQGMCSLTSFEWLDARQPSHNHTSMALIVEHTSCGVGGVGAFRAGELAS